jgi:hypothetical protein
VVCVSVSKSMVLRIGLYSYPGFRCASPWADFSNRFAVLSDRAPRRSCWSKSGLTNPYENENKILVTTRMPS